MMETKIMNDMNSNYLIIMSDGMTGSGCENKMFEYNHIKGFLPFTVSRINNNAAYQYQIMEYENLTKAFYNRTFNAMDIKMIFTAIITAGQRAEEYLLNTDAILLNPEYIFLNKDELLFCYYPGEKQSFNHGIRELMEYILERLDHKNQDNVMMAYGLYQKVLKNNFTMEMLMEEFVKPVENPVKQVTKSQGRLDLEKEKSDAPIQTMEERVSEILTLEEEFEQAGEKKEKTTRKKTGTKKNSFLNLFKRKDRTPVFTESANTMLLAEDMPYGSTQLLNMNINQKVLTNQGNGKDIILTDFPIYVGNKAGDAKCVIDNVMVSRNHAVLSWECGIYYVEDNDSTNGTYVNGSRIPPYEPVQIKEGDIICFANEKYCLN